VTESAERRTAGKAARRERRIVLMGSPNAGKSAIFGALTGRYTEVSNYPGTTVEITAGRGAIGGDEYEVVDTPGIYSLRPITEEERVARSVLMEGRPDAVVQVVDARNLERALHLTVQLLEAQVPLILVLNILDEAERLGMQIDTGELSRLLGIPVVGTVATRGTGIAELRDAVRTLAPAVRPSPVQYGPQFEEAVAVLSRHGRGERAIAARAAALLAIEGDDEMLAAIERDLSEAERVEARGAIAGCSRSPVRPADYVIAMHRQGYAAGVVARAVRRRNPGALPLAERLSRLAMRPLTGIPILLAAILGFYEFVGVFGAQVAVNFLEQTVFGQYVNPPITRLVAAVLPWPAAQDLLVNEYGVFTLGIRYAVAIILPIVTAFFLAFSLIEDSGYLPRLAMLIDRVFKRIGLNGRAVIPLVLGFGCDTMATMVTRTLETKRERVLATFLLALAVPCSAQIGVIVALLAGKAGYLWVFVGVMTAVFLLVGLLAARVMPGSKPVFYMEIPPLRLPQARNVLVKTYVRLVWYFKEILPLFVLASALIWAGRLTGLFDLAVKAFAYPVQWIGLPASAAPAFLFGFFRRDFGAAGLYDMMTAGSLHGYSLVVACVTLALFMPCVAQFAVTVKERGWKMAVGMAAFIFPFAFAVGGLVNGLFILSGAAR
jgi:ferrous iron transport protein B